MLVLVDGYVSAVVARYVIEVYPEVKDYVVLCQKTVFPGHQFLLNDLELEALMDIGSSADDGAGIALAFPLLQAATCFMNEVRTFDEAKIARPYH